MTMTKHSQYFFAALGLLLLGMSACSTIPTSRPEAPDVKLLSVEPVKIGLTSQDLAFELEVTNPNAFALPLQTLSFIAAVENKEIARGFSNEHVTLPANGVAVMEIIVSTSLSRVIGQLLSLAGSTKDSVNYDVSGFIKLANWPLRIPFGVDGNISQ